MARVIRGFGSGAVVPRALLDAEARAAARIAAAEERAAAIIDAAERSAEEVRARAADAGRRDGLAEVAGALLGAQVRRDRALAEAEREIVGIAAAIARRLVGDAVERDERAVVALARAAIDRARGAARLRVRTAPADAPALVALLHARGADVTIEPDPTLGAGDCVVDGDSGVVDGRIETRIEALREALLAELDRART